MSIHDKQTLLDRIIEMPQEITIPTTINVTIIIHCDLSQKVNARFNENFRPLFEIKEKVKLESILS